jgi:hypothetical protein
MTYKAQPIHEGGDIARSMAAMCRVFNISAEYVHLEVGFTDEGRHFYHLHGRASAYFSFDEKGATYEEAETKACRALEQWRTYGIDGDAKPEAAPAKPAVEVAYITQAQKVEILRLLAHPLITREEKTKTMLNLNRLDEERAAQHIIKLSKAIEDREGIRVAA